MRGRSTLGHEIRHTQGTRGVKAASQQIGREKWPGMKIFPVAKAEQPPPPVNRDGSSWWVGKFGAELAGEIRQQQSRMAVSRFGLANQLHYIDDVFVERKRTDPSQEIVPAPPRPGLSRVPA